MCGKVRLSLCCLVVIVHRVLSQQCWGFRETCTSVHSASNYHCHVIPTLQAMYVLCEYRVVSLRPWILGSRWRGVGWGVWEGGGDWRVSEDCCSVRITLVPGSLKIKESSLPVEWAFEWCKCLASSIPKVWNGNFQWGQTMVVMLSVHRGGGRKSSLWWW